MSAPLSDATNSPKPQQKKSGMFSRYFSRQTKSIEIKPEEPVFFAVVHEFIDASKAEAFWKAFGEMTQEQMAEMNAKNDALGFHNHSYMPSSAEGPVLCLWEVKPEATTETMQTFIDSPDGPTMGAMINTVHKAMPGAIVPSSFFSGPPAGEPAKTTGSFFWVHHTFQEGAADGFWEMLSKMSAEDMAAMQEKNATLGFHNHAFLPCSAEGPCICIWESKEPMASEEFQTFIDGPDGPGAGLVFKNVVHAAMEGAALPSAKFSVDPPPTTEPATAEAKGTLLGAPISGHYVFNVKEGADMAMLMEGLKEYSAKSAASPGKLSCNYGISADKKQLFWWEICESMDAITKHVENCLPTYQGKIVPNVEVVSMVATCDPAVLTECTAFFSQWGAKTVTVSATVHGTTAK